MAELEYGTVVGRYRLVDANVARGATGTVKFKPIEPDEITDQETLYTRIPVEASFDGEGWLGPKDSDADSLTLAVGRWEVSFPRDTGLTIRPFQFDVVADETVLLPMVQPLTPSPAVKFVVNEAVYTETLAARTAAEVARDEALEARDEARQAAEDAAVPTETYVDERIAVKRAAANGLAPLGSDSKVPDTNLPTRLSEAGLSATFVRFVDQNGDPLPAGSVTTIHVNTTTGDIDDITFEEA